MRTLLILTVILASRAIASEPPNVILIMCDDLGYGDPKCFNEDSPISTPNIDAMAADGLTFTRFYAAAPVCSPTRGSCLTGRHPYRYGIPFANVGHLPKAEITIPEILKPLGYTSGHFGKWHLGTLTKTIKDANRGGPKGAEHFSPPRWHGFDESFVTESKVPTYDPMRKPEKAKQFGWDYLRDDQSSQSYGTYYWDHEGEAVTENLRGDDSRIIMDRVIPFVSDASTRGQRFFASVWFHAPHWPVVAGPEHVEAYESFPIKQRNYYGCVSALDQQIGRLRKTLSDLGVADDTMIWFCSDNGPEGNEKDAGSAGPFRGRKRSLYEGGVRVPGILVWPGHASPGSSTNFASVTSDYLPTIAAAANTTLPSDVEIDGQSLIGAIAGENGSRSKPIGFKSRKQAAWHDGNWKLITQDQGKTWELYDLVADPSESNDVSSQHADHLNAMIAGYERWNAVIDQP